jgi:thymidylate synthase (FAD)
VKTAQLAVKVLAATYFDSELAQAETGWSTNAEGGEALAELSGRACYRSWTKPNPATATNAGYIRHILEVGHLSVLEHGTATLWFTGISRSCSHEIVRHRHISPSQESQRYVPSGDLAMVEPDVIAGDPELHKLFTDAANVALDTYSRMLERLEEKFADLPDGTNRRKQARQAARSVLPNAAETRMVLTANYRAWRHFIDLRATEHADVEIRAAAIAALRELQQVAPNVFADYVISKLDDGTEVAASPYAERS